MLSTESLEINAVDRVSGIPGCFCKWYSSKQFELVSKRRLQTSSTSCYFPGIPFYVEFSYDRIRPIGPPQQFHKTGTAITAGHIFLVSRAPYNLELGFDWATFDMSAPVFPEKPEGYERYSKFNLKQNQAILCSCSKGKPTSHFHKGSVPWVRANEFSLTSIGSSHTRPL